MDLTPGVPATGELSDEGTQFMKAVNSIFRDPDGLRVGVASADRAGRLAHRA